MINLNKYAVTELSVQEQQEISGGGFFREIGRLVGRLWCKIKSMEIEPLEKPPGMTWNEYNGKF